MCAACLDLHKLRHCILIPSLCIYLRFWPLTFYDSDNRYLDGRGVAGRGEASCCLGSHQSNFHMANGPRVLSPGSNGGVVCESKPESGGQSNCGQGLIKIHVPRIYK